MDNALIPRVFLEYNKELIQLFITCETLYLIAYGYGNKVFELQDVVDSKITSQDSKYASSFVGREHKFLPESFNYPKIYKDTAEIKFDIHAMRYAHCQLRDATCQKKSESLGVLALCICESLQSFKYKALIIGNISVETDKVWSFINVINNWDLRCENFHAALHCLNFPRNNYCLEYLARIRELIEDLGIAYSQEETFDEEFEMNMSDRILVNFPKIREINDELDAFRDTLKEKVKGRKVMSILLLGYIIIIIFIS
jgi:hypothetical protein